MRIVLHTRLRAGAESAYDEAHRHVPAELVRSIRAAGATSWTIWRSGVELFSIVECQDYPALLAALAPLPVNVRWQEQMVGLQEISHDYSPDGASACLPVVWDLAAEPPG